MSRHEELQPFADVALKRYFERGLNDLSDRDQVLVLLWSYGALVGNGGHASWLFSQLADHAPLTAAALEQIGLAQYSANLLEVITKAFPISFPTHHSSRVSLLEDYGEDNILQLADARYLGWGGREAILDKLALWYTRQQA